MLSAQADTNLDLSDRIFQHSKRIEAKMKARKSTANKQQSDHGDAHRERRWSGVGQ
jgi:hypothetical protein